MTFYVFWWVNDVPYVDDFEDEVEAEASARVRNALVVEVDGKITKMVDYYRRDPKATHCQFNTSRTSLTTDFASECSIQAEIRW